MQHTSAAVSHAEERATSTFQRVMESAPMGLLISAALGLAIVGVFQYLFYLDVLPSGWNAPLRCAIASATAAFFEALGLFFLITTVRDFSAHARREGFIGLLATCLLWVYAVWEATHVAAAFDRDTPESYMAVFGIIGTIVCIVRIVELRIALTVTSAVQRTDYRKQLNELAGKVNRYEAEMKAEEDRKKAEADRLAQLEAAEAERRKEEEIATMRRELAAARRELSKVEATPGGKIKVSAEKVNAAIRDFMRKNRGMKPSRAQIAAAVQVDERSLRNHFPNGSLDTVIEQLFREVNQQPETTDAR